MLIQHSAYYLFARGIPAAIALASLFVYTRVLSPEQYGIYAMVLSAMGIISAAAFQWLSLGLGRFYPSHQTQESVLLSTITFGFLAVVGMTAVLGYAFRYFLPSLEASAYVGVVLLLTWSQAWFELNQRRANALLSPLRYGVLSTAKAVLALVCGVTLFLLAGLNGLFAGIVLATIVSVLMFARSGWAGISFGAADFPLLKKLLRYGLPLAMALIFTLIVDVSDRFIIAWLIGADAAGLYSATYDFVQQGIGAPLAIVYLAAYPLVVQALEQGKSDLVSQGLGGNAVLLLVVSAPLLVSMAMLSGNLSEVILGPPFRMVGEQLMPWIGIAIFLGCMKIYHYDLSFQLGKKTLGQVWTTAAAALANVILNLLWIPSYGLLGAAWATLCAFGIGVALSAVLGRRVFPLPKLPRDSYKIALAASVMALVYVSVESYRGVFALAVQLLCGVAAYAVFLVALNVGDSRKRIAYLICR